MLVGAPDLGRYVAFGQLFARFGIGSEGAIHRLDRHPAMVSHPVTPMQEADLLRHLAAQTKLGRALVDMIALEGDASAALDRVLEDESVGVVLFDGLTAEHLQVVGRLIDERGTAPWFSVGSSAVSTALATATEAASMGTELGERDAVLMVSGSCSPVTAGEIAWAEEHGFLVIDVSPEHAAVSAVSVRVVTALRTGRSVVVCTSRGEVGAVASAREVGLALGSLAREAVAAGVVRRVVVVGGDTSCYAGRTLGIESLTMMGPLARGAPLCRACGTDMPIEDLEIVFKGGTSRFARFSRFRASRQTLIVICSHGPPDSRSHSHLRDPGADLSTPVPSALAGG
ncbi:MAG: hypothetical protein J6386_19040 [Candidatus Synoicihabitans palmerolidicus]|nr:hypothetical protein [Candidatus Synoicihabitans palmerolidicus]